MNNTRLDRAASVAALAEGTFDLLIVGGGITGAGVAREASLRGFRVASDIGPQRS